MSPTSIVAYLVLFAGVGFALVFGALLMGRFLRIFDRSPEKLETYECGEPPVGSSYVQYDLRFYVVALVFIIFEVEVAFFFPWAVVFGKSAQMKGIAQAAQEAGPAASQQAAAAMMAKISELGIDPAKTLPTGAAAEQVVAAGEDAVSLGRAALIEMGAFFAILLVGFAYVWSRGDLDWVRAIGQPTEVAVSPPELSLSGSSR